MVSKSGISFLWGYFLVRTVSFREGEHMEKKSDVHLITWNGTINLVMWQVVVARIRKPIEWPFHAKKRIIWDCNHKFPTLHIHPLQKEPHHLPMFQSEHNQNMFGTTTYTPENKHGIWKYPLGKGETSTNHQFLGSMFVLGGVLQVIPPRNWTQPLKIGNPKRKGSSSNHPFFQGLCLLNFGGLYTFSKAGNCVHYSVEDIDGTRGENTNSGELSIGHRNSGFKTRWVKSTSSKWGL